MQPRVQRCGLCHGVQGQQEDHVGRDAKQMRDSHRTGDDDMMTSFELQPFTRTAFL